jgi:hypothetical protein
MAIGSGSVGTASFKNYMRLSSLEEFLITPAFKISISCKNGTNDKHWQSRKNRIWLSLSNTQGVFKQMLIGYVTGATNDYDRGFDAVSFNGNSFVDFIALITTSFWLSKVGRYLFRKQMLFH